MEPFVTVPRVAAIAIAAAFLTLGCDREPPAPVSDEPPTVPSDDLPSSVVPAPTKHAARPAPDMTSYEVAIAIAAANRKKAEADCDTLPTEQRESCMTDVESEWVTTRTALDDLRGEQQ